MKVTLIGIGMGNVETLTVGAMNALNGADCVIGAKRMLEMLPNSVAGNRICEILPDKIMCAIENQTAENICVIFSGDTGFFSGATKLKKMLSKYDVTTICGVSSVQYFASKINKTWQNWNLVSAHGIDCDIVQNVAQNEEVFFLTGGKISARDICEKLCDCGFDEARVYIGENLSYKDEIITKGTAKELCERDFAPLAVVLVENYIENTREFVTHGICDDEFIRGDAPMTKQEIRAVSLSKLRVKKDDICYDIGAGTGSVAVELALLAKNGKVFAIESEELAFELIEENRKKFCATNLYSIHGMAPTALNELTAPNVAFIGGSKGNLGEILEVLVEKNPKIRVVINAITLETLSSAIAEFKRLNFENVDISQINVSRAKKLGNYNMMTALNPIYVICGEGGGNE